MKLYLHCDSSLHLRNGFVAYGYVLSRQPRAETILSGEGIFVIKGSTISRHFELWGIKQALIDCKYLLSSCLELDIRNDSWQAIHTLQRVIAFPEADHAIACIEAICRGKTLLYNQVTAVGPQATRYMRQADRLSKKAARMVLDSQRKLGTISGGARLSNRTSAEGK